jgi:radical SAM superfamily enzyme
MLLVEQGAVAANAGQTVMECHYIDGWVIDRASRKNVTFCAEQSSNNDHQHAASPLYVSASNQVQIVLRQSRHHKFLIRFEGETNHFQCILDLLERPWTKT